MGSFTRPSWARLTPPPGRHRGELAPILDVDVSAAAGRAAAGLATAGAAGAVVVTGAGAAGAAPAHADAASTADRAAYAAPSAGQLAALRQCESGGNYATNTGNGFYGAYQFDLRTWRGLGYAGRPDQASPGTQDEAATRLEESRGWQPWPACSRKLGLSAAGGAASTSRGALASRPAGTQTQSHAVAVAVPAFPGTALTTALVGTKRADVLVWQSRMARRGWDITVDGYFGPQSASIARQFAAEKKVETPDGTVNQAAWTAAWTAPIT